METASSADMLSPDRNAGVPVSLEELMYQDNMHITAVAFNRKGSLLAAGCKCGTVLVWDMGTRGVVQELKPAPRPAPPGPGPPPEEAPAAPSAGADGAAAAAIQPAAAGAAGAGGGPPDGPGRGSPGDAQCVSVSWSHDGRRLLGAQAGGQITLWAVKTGQALDSADLQGRSAVKRACLHPFEHRAVVSQTQGFPLAVAFSHASAPASRGPGPGTVVEVKLQVDPRLSEEKGAQLGYLCTYSKDGKHLVVGSSRGHMALLSADAGYRALSCEKIFGGPTVRDLALSFSTYQKVVASCQDKTVRVFTIDGDRLSLLSEHQHQVEHNPWGFVRFSKGDEHIVSSTEAKDRHNLYIWSLANATLEAVLEGPRESVLGFDCHPSKPLFAVVSAEGVICVWTKQHVDNWSAFAPDFKELKRNYEVLEHEDEFDIKHVPSVTPKKPTNVHNRDIDILGPKRAKESDNFLHYVPVYPDPTPVATPDKAKLPEGDLQPAPLNGTAHNGPDSDAANGGVAMDTLSNVLPPAATALPKPEASVAAGPAM